MLICPSLRKISTGFHWVSEAFIRYHSAPSLRNTKYLATVIYQVPGSLSFGVSAGNNVRVPQNGECVRRATEFCHKRVEIVQRWCPLLVVQPIKLKGRAQTPVPEFHQSAELSINRVAPAAGLRIIRGTPGEAKSREIVSRRGRDSRVGRACVTYGGQGKSSRIPSRNVSNRLHGERSTTREDSVTREILGPRLVL